MTTKKNTLPDNIVGRVIIAIDPDVEKSGVCYFNVDSKKIESAQLTFPELLDYLKWLSEKAKAAGVTALIVVEAGWLNKAHWHGAYQKGSRVSARIGNATGRNHETGRKIVECARHYGLEVIEQRPLTKRWHGTDGKITADELDMVLRGMHIAPMESRTNQDQRDAILLAVIYADRVLQC